MIYTIENENLRVNVASLGGHLSSIFDKKKNKELLHQPDPKSWMGQDLSCFPWVARLVDKTYTYNGKTYSLECHGISRGSEYRLVKKDNHSLTLKIESNEEYLKVYPFKFTFFIHYELKDNILTVNYQVVNNDDKTMYYGLGGHPALNVDTISNENGDNTDGNYLLLDKEYNLKYILLDETGCFGVEEKEYGKTNRIHLGKKLFKDFPTLILKADDFDKVTLLKKSGEKVVVNFPNHIHYLAIWSFPEFGSYVAIEPWNSLPDYLNNPKEISQKKTVLSLKPNQKDELTYQIIV